MPCPQAPAYPVAPCRTRLYQLKERSPFHRQIKQIMRKLLVPLLVCLSAAPAAAQAEAPRIGVVSPYGEGVGMLGAQMRAGADLAAREAGIVLTHASEGCSAEGGAAAARRMIGERIDIVLGFLCTEAIETALPLLSEAGLPVLTTGVRNSVLTDQRERTGWQMFRLAPRSDDEQRAVAQLLPRMWREELFAIVDDGTIYGRELAEALRFAAEEINLEPVYTDTYRPQLDNQVGLVGRLRRAGATHLFIGGDRDDIAIIARDAAALDYELTIVGGEALRAAPGDVDLPAGVMMIGLPEWEDVAAPEVVAALREEKVDPIGYAIPGYVAVEIAVEAAKEASRDGITLAEALSERDFYTAIGPIRFTPQGDLASSWYRLFRYDGEDFAKVDED
jgi:branched-chain amino acid transport system substrate-binding protein